MIKDSMCRGNRYNFYISDNSKNLEMQRFDSKMFK